VFEDVSFVGKSFQRSEVMAAYEKSKTIGVEMDKMTRIFITLFYKKPGDKTGMVKCEAPLLGTDIYCD